VFSRAVVSIKTRITKWFIRRHIKRLKLNDSLLPPNQQIENLTQQIALLKAMQHGSPNVSLYDQLKTLEQRNLPPLEPTLVAPPVPIAASEPPPAPVAEVASVVPVVQPEPEITPMTPPEPAVAAPAAVAAPVSKGSTLPDVKMLAPILKIALATLSIEQMVEIGLHVKMGAPGFQQFLDSDVAKVKFRELYATYCEFLAGKVK
jgi:hypothetical protein